MKIKLSCLPEEQASADYLRDLLKRELPTAKIRECQEHPPFRHIYLTVEKSKRRLKSEVAP